MAQTRRIPRPSSSARALLAVVTLSSIALADQEPIDLVYRTHEGCPSERQFVEMVVGRAAKTLVLSERARGRKFYVTVTQQRRETIGKLEIVAGGTTAAREVSGANCSEVVSALALFTALANRSERAHRPETRTASRRAAARRIETATQAGAATRIPPAHLD